MIAFIQRVTEASVTVDDKKIAQINQGLLVLWGVEKNDDEAIAQRLLEKVIKYRVFADKSEKMNLSLLDLQAELLIVPQFTLAANTDKGLRPSFSSAAAPDKAKALFEYSCDLAEQQLKVVAKGRFGADMQVALVNDGPVSFWLQI